MRLTVLTYNVHKCVGGLDRRYRPERVVETAAHHAPDIVLLQECGNGTETGPRWHRQVDVLADGLGLGHRAWFPNHRYRRGGEYGNACCGCVVWSLVAVSWCRCSPRRGATYH